MKIILNLTLSTIVLLALTAITGCGPSGQKPQTEPTATTTPKPVTEAERIEQLRKPVAKDPAMFKAVKVIREYGKIKKKSISYKKYQQLTKGQTGGAINPDWFYDSYDLAIKENNHWITLTYGTSKDAKESDPRIANAMTGLPDDSISVQLKTPQGKSYFLTDAQADGVLDYAARANQQGGKIDVKLLDAMQEKYTWILGVIKKYYKNLKK